MLLAGIPDIHAVVDRIASIGSASGSVNTSKVRQTLLEQWLVSSAGMHQLESADVTMVGEESTSSPVDAEEGDASEVDLLRAVYLLQHPGLSSTDTLLSLISSLSDCDPGASVSQPVRATRCLFMLSDVETVRRLCPGRSWVDYLTALLYTAQLRGLRIIPSGGSLSALDKSGVVRSLCRCHGDSSGRVAASLAADFGLSDPQIWNAVIRRLCASGLELLVGPLPCLDGQLTAAVSSEVMSWLDKDVVDLSVAVRVCLLLHRCPSYVDEGLLRRCAEEFRRHGLPLCAVACALMLPPGSARTHLIQSVTDSSASSGSADRELAELELIGHVLPTTRQIVALLNGEN